MISDETFYKKREFMEKIDYKKQLKHLYKPSAKKVEIVNVPEMNFVLIDGQGDPNNLVVWAKPKDSQLER